MAKPKYPLEQVLTVKKDRVDKAEKVVKEKQRALEIEEEKLRRVEKERDQVKSHHADKLAQLRAAMDEGTTSDEVLQMKAYLKVVQEKLKKAEEKVKEQSKQVATAQKNLDVAKEDLRQKRVEQEKIEIHKEEWEKQSKKERAAEEAKQQDEIGQAMYQAHKRRKES